MQKTLLFCHKQGCAEGRTGRTSSDHRAQWADNLAHHDTAVIDDSMLTVAPVPTSPALKLTATISAKNGRVCAISNKAPGQDRNKISSIKKKNQHLMMGLMGGGGCPKF